MMKSNETVPKNQSKKLDNMELLEWATHRIQRCQNESFYGSLQINFENGRIVRTETKRSEVPQ